LCSKTLRLVVGRLDSIPSSSRTKSLRKLVQP